MSNVCDFLFAVHLKNHFRVVSVLYLPGRNGNRTKSLCCNLVFCW